MYFLPLIFKTNFSSVFSVRGMMPHTERGGIVSNNRRGGMISNNRRGGTAYPAKRGGKKSKRDQGFVTFSEIDSFAHPELNHRVKLYHTKYQKIGVIIDNCFFLKDKEAKGIFYWRCKTKTCRVRCSTSTDFKLLSHSVRQHTHPAHSLSDDEYSYPSQSFGENEYNHPSQPFSDNEYTHIAHSFSDQEHTRQNHSFNDIEHSHPTSTFFDDHHSQPAQIIFDQQNTDETENHFLKQEIL